MSHIRTSGHKNQRLYTEYIKNIDESDFEELLRVCRVNGLNIDGYAVTY